MRRTFAEVYDTLETAVVSNGFTPTLTCGDGFYLEEGSCYDCQERFENSLLCDYDKVIECEEGFALSYDSLSCAYDFEGVIASCQNPTWIYFYEARLPFTHDREREVQIVNEADECSFYFPENKESTQGTCLIQHG